MSGYDVDTAELYATGSLVRQATADGRGRLERLRLDADELLGHGWRGRAASAFQAGWREWDEGARRMLCALEEMARALDASARDYERQEATATAGLRSVA